MAKSIPLFFILLGLLLSVSYAGGEKTKGKRDGGLMRLITKRTGAKRTGEIILPFTVVLAFHLYDAIKL